MDLTCVAIGLLLLLVTLLLRAEFAQPNHFIYFLKPASTVLVIFIALYPVVHGDIATSRYFFLIATGLVFSLAGDVALMGKSGRSFKLGLIFFLMAHIFYSWAFSIPADFSATDGFVALGLLCMAGLIYRYLYPGLGPMKLPVLIYVLIITVMMERAISRLYAGNFPQQRAMLIAIGAGLFYISDLILAINKFRRPMRYHRISLAFYYAGQLLIALSVRP
ncbi:MAG: lysoplasmalogenase [Candidatus Zhuqueibacterota bacterium]